MVLQGLPEGKLCKIIISIIHNFFQEEWGMTSVDFRNGDWGKLRGDETTKLDREILADISGRRNDLGLRWFLMHPVHV